MSLLLTIKKASAQQRRSTTHSPRVNLSGGGLGSQKSLPQEDPHAKETRAASGRRDLEPKGEPRRKLHFSNTRSGTALLFGPNPNFQLPTSAPQQDKDYLEEAAATG